MGLSLSATALSHSDSVCAVGRVGETTPTQITNLHPNVGPDTYLGLLCDVRIRSTVATAITTCITHFGRLDVVANCSGYGVIGACEDQDESLTRSQFETNFMGTLNIIQLSLPYFREREEGRYLIFSSTSGALGVPGQGPYCATKYAVEGLMESMLYEVDGFGIRVSLVEPGYLRRDDERIFGYDGVGGDEGKVKVGLYGHFKVLKESKPYESADSPAKHAKRILQWIGDNQSTSVVKSAELVWQLAHCDYPPLRLLLGTYAVESVRDRLKSVIEEIEDWKGLNFPPMQEEDQDEEGDEDDKDEDEDPDGHDGDDQGGEGEDEEAKMEDA